MSISDLPPVKYCKCLKEKLDKSKENILKEYIIVGTCFTSVATIIINLFSRYPKNMNFVHIYNKDILSVISILVTNGSGEETVFMEGTRTNNFGEMAHILKH